MLTNLRKTALYLLVLALMAGILLNCSKKQIASAADTNSNDTEQVVESKESITSASDLQKYTGRYDFESDDINWTEITLENDKLYGQSDARPKTELIKESGDTFKVQGMNATVTFTRNGQQIKGIVISYDGNEYRGQKVK
jgi:hypothetical protein